MTIRCAVIGVGYLGRFHAQKYAALPESTLVGVVDANPERAAQVADELGCAGETDYRAILDGVDAVSIVTPTVTHHKIARDCLERGLHVLVEKPITTTLEEADELIALAHERRRVLQVGHLERFNPAVRALGTRLSHAPLFVESHRIAPFKPRATDVNVVLDLMIHDIDIVLDLVRSEVTDIRASGASVLSDAVDIANARIEFASGCVANVTSSRISQKSERKMRLFMKDAYITVDFQEKALDIYQKGQGEMFPGIANISHDRLTFGESDALREEIKDFLRAIRTGETPAVTGEDGRRALATALRISALFPVDVPSALK